MLSYLEGTVPHISPFDLSDEQLLSGVELVLAFHDATAMSPLCDGHAVVCRGDLGTHSTVFLWQRAVAIIDWPATSDLGDGRTISRTLSEAPQVLCRSHVGCGSGLRAA